MIFKKMSYWSALTVCALVSLLLLLLFVVWLVTGTTCDTLQQCDKFASICAVDNNEHQFFYSQCDMVRENCMTGANWKLDHFSHCNVYV